MFEGKAWSPPIMGLTLVRTNLSENIRLGRKSITVANMTIVKKSYSDPS
jgi:hypothetical protein